MKNNRIKDILRYGSLVLNVLLFSFLPFFILSINYKNVKEFLLNHVDDGSNLQLSSAIENYILAFYVNWENSFAYLLLCTSLVIIIFLIKTVNINKVFLIFVLEIGLFISGYEGIFAFSLVLLIHFNFILVLLVMYYQHSKSEFSIKYNLIYSLVVSIILIILLSCRDLFYTNYDVFIEYLQNEINMKIINTIKSFIIINSFYTTYIFLLIVLLIVNSLSLIVNQASKYLSMFKEINMSYFKSIMISVLIFIFIFLN